MSSVIEVVPKEGIPDVRGERIKKYINDFMCIPINSVRTSTLYFFSNGLSPEQADYFGRVYRILEEGQCDILIPASPNSCISLSFR